MKIIKYLHILLLCCLTVTALSQAPPTIEFQNGLWFNGKGFVNKAMYSENGIFRTSRPAKIDTIISLDNHYIVSPYGDAHNHLVDPDVKKTIQQYLKDGVYYVMDHGNIPMIYNMYKPYINTPKSIDMISPIYFFTGNDGHPQEVLDNAAKNGMIPKNWVSDKLVYGICILDTLTDLDIYFPEVLKAKPDFIKSVLYCSEEYDLRKNDTAYRYQKGMNPRLLPELVKRAHLAGLRVSVHIQSRADFLTAINARVDIIAHTPGMGYEARLGKKSFIITDGDARLCAEYKIPVITTLSFLKYLADREQDKELIKNDIIIPNIKLLIKYHVNLVIGVDQFQQTSKEEALFIATLGIFNNLELLKMWCETTTKMIFPNRKIGELKDGYEASFLVLDGNPLNDFLNTTKITQRYKQGFFLVP